MSTTTASTSPSSTQNPRPGEAFLSQYLGLFGIPESSEDQVRLALHLHQQACSLEDDAKEVRAAAELVASCRVRLTATSPEELPPCDGAEAVNCHLVIDTWDAPFTPWPGAFSNKPGGDRAVRLEIFTLGGVDLFFEDPRYGELTRLMFSPTSIAEGIKMAQFFTNVAFEVLQAGANAEQRNP